MTPSLYETSNVYLASFLYSQGITLDGFTRPSARRVVYRFLADETLHELLRLYWGNFPLPIVPTSLFDALQNLKRLVRRRPVGFTQRPLYSSPPAALPPPGHAER
jgi:hypothetical protein